jgi:hypothetical protein
MKCKRKATAKRPKSSGNKKQIKTPKNTLKMTNERGKKNWLTNGMSDNYPIVSKSKLD